MRKFTKEITALLAAATVSASSGAISASSEEIEATVGDIVAPTEEYPAVDGGMMPPDDYIEQPTTTALMGTYTTTTTTTTIPPLMGTYTTSKATTTVTTTENLTTTTLVGTYTTCTTTTTIPPLAGEPMPPDEYIEDTIFCNNRSISSLNGWDPDGSTVNNLLLFNEFHTNSNLSCTNATDQFSISNNNAKLNYKVGLMSSPEMNILHNSNIRKTGQSYWLIGSIAFSNSAINAYINSNGAPISNYVDNRLGVRPMISLIPGIRYSTGDGSMANPYIVYTRTD